MMATFDNRSVLWRYVGDARFVPLLGRVFLLQLMHPTIAAGVADHSRFQTDPWGRLHGSWDLVLRTVYASDGADVGQQVRAMHKTIKGTDRHGRAYHAYEPEAYWWVLGAALESLFVFADRFAAPMTTADKARAYAETRELGRRFGLRDRDMPATLDQFVEWDAEIHATRLEDNPVVHAYLDLVAHPPPPPPCPRLVWPPFRATTGHVARLLTIGTLPRPTRELLGVRWTGVQEVELRGATRCLRALDVVPVRWRYLPQAREAFRRHATGNGETLDWVPEPAPVPNPGRKVCK